MKCIETTWQKKSASALIIAVILFIHAVKLCHAHQSIHSADWYPATVKVEKGDDCLICDLHFANDTYYPLPSIAHKKQPGRSIYPILYTSNVVSSTGFNYSDRGPPTIA